MKRGYEMKKYRLWVDMVNTARIVLANEPAGHRVVEIELTSEQVELINPKFTGSIGGVDYYEEIHPISIQEIK